MRYNHLLLPAMMTAAISLTGCVDNDYDLSDIDTTVQLQVKDLTLPINFDPIELKSILKPSDTSCIKETDAGYAVLETGKFKSDPIKIESQTVKAPEVKPTVRDIYEITGSEGAGDTEVEMTVAYSIVDVMGDFEYDKDDVPAEILGLKSIGVDWTLSINVSVSDPTGMMRSLKFENVIISLPKGLTTTDSRYDAVSGDLTVGEVTLPSGTTSYTLSVPVTAIDLSKWNGDEFKFTPASTPEGKGKVHFAGHVGVKSGEAVIGVLVNLSHPSSVVMTMAPKLSNIAIKSFSGRVQYTLSNFDIPDVDISDLPGLLADEETSITLENPQLYLSVNNPMSGYKLDATTSLQLTPMRDGVAGDVCSLDAGQSINIGHSKGIDGRYDFCISPDKPAVYYAGYEDATHVGCKDLSTILAGKGVPTSIKVKMPGARVLPGDVVDFKLGVDMGRVVGDYTVYCPLALGESSRVVYSDDIDGWNDETVDRIVISKMAVTTTIVNGLPFDIVLSGYPLSVTERDGKPKQSVDPVTGHAVSIAAVRVAANTSTTITVETDGTVEHLDGIHFVARGVVDEADAPVISPENTIKLTDLRVKVSGSYTDKL